MLLLLYGPGLIGGLIIPIMGALPDGMIILMSGLSGTDPEEIKQQITVGVGTLAGSHHHVADHSLGCCSALGRRDIDPETGEAAVYTDNQGQKPKLTGFSGPTLESPHLMEKEIPFMAKTMMATTLLYLVIQIPAFVFQGKTDALEERKWLCAQAGLILSVITFFAYSIYQVVDSRNGEIVEQRQRELELGEN